MSGRDELERLDKNELRDRARSADLKVSGTKAELVDRLADHEDVRDASGGDGTSSDDGSAVPDDALSALRAAREALAAATGLTAELTPSIEPTDGGWRVMAQAVEMATVPRSGDIVGIYEIELDRRGTLRALRRTDRGRRGQIGAA